MNLSQDPFDSTNPPSHRPGQSPVTPPEGQEAKSSVSSVCPTTPGSESNPAQVPLWNADEDLDGEAQLTPDHPLATPQVDVDPTDGGWLSEAPHSAAAAANDAKARKERDEKAIRTWVIKTLTDPAQRSIRHHYTGYRAWVFQASGSSQAISYSAFCRRVAAVKKLNSIAKRSLLRDNHRPKRDAAPGTAGHEALWVQALPTPPAAMQESSLNQDMAGTVAIAVDALTGAVRVDSQVVGAFPCDEVAVSTVKRYEQHHGRVPAVVCVDGASFHRAPLLERLCRRLGIELRVVHASRPQSAGWPPSAIVRPLFERQRIDSSALANAGKSIAVERLPALSVNSLLPAWRRGMREIALRKAATPQLRSLWPRKPAEGGREEKEQ